MAYLDQLNPEDRDALQLFADPSIDPSERAMRLEALGAPPPPPAEPDLRLALNDGAGGASSGPESLPDVPPAPIAAGAGGTTGVAPNQSMGTEGAGAVAPAPPQPDAPQPATDIPVSLDEDDAGPGRSAVPARSQFDLPFATTGGKAIPTERVTEQVSAKQGYLSPEQRAEHSAALAEGERAQGYLDTLEAHRQQRERELAVEQREADMAERARLEQVRQEEFEKARQVNEQSQRISKDVLDARVEDENLFSGQDFGNSLVSFVGLMVMGLGLGATGNAGQIVPALQARARREVDKQRRLVELKQGQLSALGTIYERHMQNYRDDELASKATMADIYAKAELELARFARDAGPTVDAATVAKNAAALRAARVEAEAQRDKALGDQVETSVQRAFMRPMVKPAAPAAAPGAAPAAPGGKPRPQDFATEGEYFQALADYVEPQPAAARPKASGGPAARAAGPTVLANAEAETGDGSVNLVQQGRYREAVEQLPEKTRQRLEQQAARIKKELGDKASLADARVLATQRFLGWPVPKGYVFQHARDRAVTDAGGNVVYAMGDNPLEVKKLLTAHNQLTGAFRSLLALANKPKAKWSPEDRATLRTKSSLIAPQIAVALGQGAMAEEEQKLYGPPAGTDINGLEDWLLGNGKAAAEAGLQSFQARRGVLLRDNFSRDPFDYVPVGAR
jgi:hypothetical protein